MVDLARVGCQRRTQEIMLIPGYRLGDVVNAWRHTLDLEPVPFSEGPGLIETLNIPFTYCWSPVLIPKPSDWAPHIGTVHLLPHEVSC